MLLFGGMIKFNKRGYALFCVLFIILVYYYFSSKQHIHNDQISITSLLQTAIEAAVAGGNLVVSVKNPEIHSKGKTKEGLDDSVTNADFLSHCAMKNIITDKFPSVKLISEEQVTICGVNDKIEYSKIITDIVDKFVDLNDITIWIDPLDATHEYTEKLFQYVTTMVCVAVKGEPVIGVIHNPFSNKTYWAIVGKGISDNLKVDHVQTKNSNIKIIISRSHRGTVEGALEKSFTNYDVVIAAGAGYKVLKVAKKEVDAYIHITAIKKWDICAGNAILKALGGRMSTKDGRELSYFSDTDVVNKDGLVATLHNHEMYINKL